MPPIDQQRADQLLALARDRFDPNLEDIEVQVLTHSCRYEDPADWTPDPTTPDPTRPETTGRPLPGCDLPTIRPTLIRWLLTDPAATALLEPRGLRVWGARLAEPLDLIGCTIPARLELRYCLVEAPIRLANASLPTLSLRNATLQQTLDAPFLKLHGPLHLDDITAAETLNFNGATITGEARFKNTTLGCTGMALSMAGASITDDLYLWPSLKSSGRLSLAAVHVGALSLRGAKLSASGIALSLDGARVRSNISLDEAFEASGEIRMPGAQIDGQLRCSGAKLTQKGTALMLDGATIGNSVLLNAGFVSAGEVRMPAAHIAGDLNCSGGRFTLMGRALSLDGAKFGKNVLLDEGFQSAGEISLLGAHISGQLRCRGGKLTSTGTAFSLDRAQIRASVYLDEGFECNGEIRMLGTHIGGQLNCIGAKLAKTGNALSLDGATVDQDVLLNGGFEAGGVIRMHSTKIGGQLICVETAIQSLVGENMEVKRDLFWKQVRRPENTRLNLMGATIGAIRDDQTSWPAKGNLFLNGLSVQDLVPLHADQLDTSGRIAWLNRQPDTQIAEPQPWVHLAGHFEAKGYKRAARRVTFELHKHQARAKWKDSYIRRRGAIAFAWLEEQPLRILWSILFLTAISGSIFTRYEAHFAPTSDASKVSSKPNDQPHAYPSFQPIVYALENVLPIVKLGQDTAWSPDANPTHTTPVLYWTLVGVRWTLIILGWAQGIVLAAAVSARFRN